MEVKIKRLTETAVIPLYVKEGDAGISQPTFAIPELAEEALDKFKDLFKDLYMLND